MKKYEVISPVLSFRVNETKKDYNLTKGNTVELPDTSIAVRALLARGVIKEIEEISKETSTSKKNKV